MKTADIATALDIPDDSAEWLRVLEMTTEQAEDFLNECVIEERYPKARAVQLQHANDARRKFQKPKRKSLAGLMQQQFARLGWIVPGLLPEGTALIVAAPKLGKSWLAYDIALAASTGTSALGTIPLGNPRPVLYFDFESGDRRIQSRMEALGVGDTLNPELFEYHTDAQNWEDEFHGFMETHKGRNPLVIVDTLAAVKKSRDRNQTDYDNDYKTLSQFQTATRQDPGAAVLIIHHTKKGATADPLEQVSGTNGLAGAVDTVIVLQRENRHSVEAELNVMSRDTDGGEYAVEWDKTTMRWILAGNSVERAQDEMRDRALIEKRNRLGGDKKALVEYLERQYPNSVSVAQLEEKFPDMGRLKPNLSELANKQQLIEPAVGGGYRALKGAN